MSAELPGVALERDAICEPTEAVEDEPEPDAEVRAAVALENADIDIARRIREGLDEPDHVGADPGKILYEIEMDGSGGHCP